MIRSIMARAATARADRRGITAAETALIAASLAMMVAFAANGLSELVSAAFTRVIGVVG